jgi:hypothetical protein
MQCKGVMMRSSGSCSNKVVGKQRRGQRWQSNDVAQAAAKEHAPQGGEC